MRVKMTDFGLTSQVTDFETAFEMQDGLASVYNDININEYKLNLLNLKTMNWNCMWEGR